MRAVEIDTCKLPVGLALIVAGIIREYKPFLPFS